MHPKILVVDDIEANRDLLQFLLEEEFEVKVANCGQACLDLMATFEPKIVLLDVKMPGMNGYVTCEKIKADNPHVAVIFVSAFTTLEDRLSGYAAGGDDYVGKPFDEQELRFKMGLALKNRDERVALSAQLSNVTSITQTVLANTSELGVVMRFMESSFRCKSVQALATKVFDATNALGLNAALRTHYAGNITHHVSHGVVTPLMRELFERAQKQSSLFSFEAKTFFTYPNLTLLVKNMPIHDEDKYGRYKDHLALLASGGSAIAQAIATAESLQAHIEIEGVIAKTVQAIDNVSIIIKNQSIKTRTITQTLGQNIQDAMLQLGLDEDQELRLTSMVDQATQALLDNIEDGQQITRAFSTILSSLQSVVTKAK